MRRHQNCDGIAGVGDAAFATVMEDGWGARERDAPPCGTRAVRGLEGAKE